MRHINRIVGLSLSFGLSALLLNGCGQSGALQLPSDPNYDQRAQYLLYTPSKTSSAIAETAAPDQPASSPAAQR